MSRKGPRVVGRLVPSAVEKDEANRERENDEIKRRAAADTSRKRAATASRNAAAEQARYNITLPRRGTPPLSRLDTIL